MKMLNDNSSAPESIRHYFGATTAKIIFYLPSAPTIPKNWHPANEQAIEQLIHANGNHWRKIMVIISKLVCKEFSDWRKVQPSLFQQSSAAHIPLAIVIVNESFEQADDLALDPNILHIICGKNTFSRFSFENIVLDQNLSLNDKQAIQYHHPVFLTPYLDYRQFPNALIALLRPMLHHNTPGFKM
ncbi:MULTISPECIES: DUF6942 family protein [Pseudomonadati]|uniref:Uncharacterized protein n=1 Tax=Shewanella aestuarii TaxID=1028752 RepID=A0ABT0L4E9_9GAMM|nr:hypothetical protein [Shewanella aestuarii]MCL1118096.1 hypothetical protein [Shewanella aestuarii]GGN81894.1 hypothetical protein GCM10009193_28480 [Shewanella aestuarii]